MELYIRADADAAIGAGHVMRCLALAQAWQDQGGGVTFISRCENEGLRQRLRDESFALSMLERVYPDPDDLERTLACLRQEGSPGPDDWFVLDGYHFTAEYQRAIHASGVKLLVMDDMNNLPAYSCDVILNHNSHAHRLTYACDAGTVVLRGTEYVFLRREFLQSGCADRKVPERARKILVILGGADPDNVTLKVIEALQLLQEPDLDVSVVVGPVNRHTASIRAALESSGLRHRLLVNPPDMAGLMADADLAVSAAGGTCWELAYMGVPCIMIIVAENQREVAGELGRAGAAVNLGWHNRLFCADMARAVEPVIASEAARSEMIRKGLAMVTGDGAALTVAAMRSYAGRGGAQQ
ncbi:UDP-2,4-diacetamido-2,4,6-trideoxy-beta-L-altropyranose hydrolase [Thermodesulfobacteriota bacterium]